ncbi:MAG: hypothetical protein ACFB0D_11310 [Phormidesmis sp.]
MEKYLLSEPIPIPKPFRWSWFALGCGCLLVGSAYLSIVDLGGSGIAYTPTDALVSADANP